MDEEVKQEETRSDEEVASEGVQAADPENEAEVAA